MNKLFIKDCKDALIAIPDESIDLIYLDPPFNTNRSWGEFDDTWNKPYASNNSDINFFLDNVKIPFSRKNYICYLADRLEALKRVLKKTGSIWVHVDSNESHYLKVIMDLIYGHNNYRNEIYWERTKGAKGSKTIRKFGVNTDTLLWYSKHAKDYYFNPPYTQLSEEEMDNKFNRLDDDLRSFRTDHITVNGGLQGKGVFYEYKGYYPPLGWRVKKETLKQMDKENRLYWSKNGKPYRKYFREEYEGKRVTNYWNDINLERDKKYPTQKPEKLLERIILSCTREGDTVLDPFCGSGTTLVVAEKLNRSYNGIDVNENVIDIVTSRVKNRNKLEVYI